MRKSGFTLVELLVVMAIIGILAGLIFPTLGGVRKRARRTQTQNLVTQVDAAWHVHFNDFRSFPAAKHFEESKKDGDDISFPMTPLNLGILNWRTPRPNDYNGTTETWMNGLVKSIKEAADKHSANKPRKLKVGNDEVATRDAYLEMDQIHWLVGMVNMWGTRAAQKGFNDDGVSGATAAITAYCKDHPDPRVWAALDTGYDGKLLPPSSFFSRVEGEDVSDEDKINKPAIAMAFSEKASDGIITSW